MEFREFRDLIRGQIDKMVIKADNKEVIDYAFVTDVDKDEMWDIYNNSFRPEDNKIFRERRKHDCSTCKHFIREVGNMVIVGPDSSIISIWDVVIPKDDMYAPVVKAMREYVKSKPIKDIYLAEMQKYGTESNYDTVETSLKWEHLYYELPRTLYSANSIIRNSKVATCRDNRHVFKRSLEEIKLDALETVLDLIKEKIVYRGEEWLDTLIKFKHLSTYYHTLLADDKKDNWVWSLSVTVPINLLKLKNTSMGVLLMDISNGVDIDTAIRSHDKLMDNYKRSKPIYTQKMLDDAKKQITELGYMESLPRRYATIDDITINNILFANRDVKQKLTGDIFADMAKSTVSKLTSSTFDYAEEVSIATFINDILPNSSDIKLFFENNMKSNLVSLITGVNKDAKSMFTWNNNFSWAYTGNITDSRMKEAVKAHGGNVDGDLRFSIMWNYDEPCDDNSDLDAHCIEPDGFRIFFSSMRSIRTGGTLDVDIRTPNGKIAVENIVYPRKDLMYDGEYQLLINCYNYNNSKNFKAEIEFDGVIRQYEYNAPMRTREYIRVATVTVKDGVFTLKDSLKQITSTTKEYWGINTGKFIPVSAIMYSPNYWDEMKGHGNKHYFFTLEGCVNDEEPNGFFNEYLRRELVTSRQVFEALGSKMKVESTENQLSGVGFSSTLNNTIVLKVVENNKERLLKVKF